MSGTLTLNYGSRFPPWEGKGIELVSPFLIHGEESTLPPPPTCDPMSIKLEPIGLKMCRM